MCTDGWVGGWGKGGGGGDGNRVPKSAEYQKISIIVPTSSSYATVQVVPLCLAVCADGFFFYSHHQRDLSLFFESKVRKKQNALATLSTLDDKKKSKHCIRPVL